MLLLEHVEAYLGKNTAIYRGEFMEYRDLECLMRKANDFNDALRHVDLEAARRAAAVNQDAVQRAASAAMSVADVVSVVDMVSVADAAKMHEWGVNPADLASRSFAATSLMPLDGLLDVQQRVWDSVSTAAAGLTQASQAVEFLKNPGPVAGFFEQYRGAGMANVADTAKLVAEASQTAFNWKPVLMGFSHISEAAFAMRLPEIDRMLYSAIRPEILSVADQLRTFNAPLQDTFVDYMGTLVEFDFSLDLDLDAPPTDEPPGSVPQEHRTLGKKRVVVWLADRPIKVEIFGISVGEAAGVGLNTMMDGAVSELAGDLAGNVGGGVMGYALSKALVIVVRRYRDRL